MTTSHTDIAARVIKVLSTVVYEDIADIKPETTLASINLDSLDRVELTMALEDEFSGTDPVSFDEVEFETAATVADIIAVVTRRLSA